MASRGTSLELGLKRGKKFRDLAGLLPTRSKTVDAASETE